MFTTICKIINNFFGESITVSGLLTGKDMYDQLKDKPLGEELLIPQNCLRHGEDVFLCGMTLDELKAHYERGGLGDMKVKRFLNEVLQETLAPIRERREELAKDIPAIWDMLYKGSEVARAAAGETLAEVKKAMKIEASKSLSFKAGKAMKELLNK